MSKLVSLKVQDPIFKDLEEIIRFLKTPRNRYINKALEHFNAINRKKMLKKQLVRESEIVQKTSMEVLKEFEQLDDNHLQW